MAVRFNTPPGWPVPSEAWIPTEGWVPDPSWPAPPENWSFWVVEHQRPPRPGSRADAAAAPRPGTGRFEPRPPRLGAPPRSTQGPYGTDRSLWLSRLRDGELVVPPPASDADRVDRAVDVADAAGSPGAQGAPGGTGATEAWAMNGPLVPVGPADA